MRPSTSRRRLLRGGAGALAVALAGCSGGDEPPEPATVGDRGDDDSLANRSCPPVETGHDRVVCSHTVATEDAPVFLTVAPERAILDGTLPSERVDLHLHNRSSGPLAFNPHSWRGWHDPGDGWRELDRQVSGDGTTTVGAGGTHSWSLVEAAGSFRPDPTFEPGSYALAISVPRPETRAQWVACLAVVRLVHPGGN